MDEITALSFDSDPGVYEVKVEGGKVYEVEIPEDYVSRGRMILSHIPDHAEDFTDRDILRLYHVDATVGRNAAFELDGGAEKPMTRVMTRRVVTIKKVK